MVIARCGRIGVAVTLCLTAITGCTNPGEQQLTDLVGDPDAALAFFYPDGVVEPGTSPVAIEYIRDRNWSNDGFGLLAQVLDEAATTHRDADDPLAELSALAATDTINLLGQRHDEIGDTAYDSLGHLLSNYIVDIDIRVQPMPSSLAEPELALPGLPPGAHFDRASLDAVTRQVLQSTDAFRDVTGAALQLNTYRIADAIESGNPVKLNWAMIEGKDLLQYVGVSAGFDDLTEPDDRTTAMFDQLDEAVTLQPATGAQFDDYIAGGEPLTPSRSFSFDDESDNPSLGLEHTLWIATRLNAGAQLGDAGLLDTTSPNGETAQWYADGEFNLDVALDMWDIFLAQLEYSGRWSDGFDLGYSWGRLGADD